MNSVVCTFYENHYHYGVAALINSLYDNGFRGHVFVGYRGGLPPWADKTYDCTVISWSGSSTLKLSEDLQVHFLPVATKVHFTNYKPFFVLDLWEKCTTLNPPGIFYFDPDIVNKCNWQFYENWIRYGIAIVHEIVWNDMPANHPKRHQWLTIAELAGVRQVHELHSYVNAGFFGIRSNAIAFVQLWKMLIETAEKNGLFDPSQFFQSKLDSDVLRAGDQDLFNLALMCTEAPLSEFGPEGMDFLNGGWLMSHATGSPKPWKTSHLREWFKGRQVSLQSKAFWKYANGIIQTHSESKIKKVLLAHKVVAVLSRFYSK
jgi:hypothetical protein